MTVNTLSTTSSGLVVSGGETLTVVGGGQIVSGGIDNGGLAIIASGGFTTLTNVNPGGTEEVFGGVIVSTTVTGDSNDGLGGTLEVASGGITSDTLVAAAAVETVLAGGLAIGTSVTFVAGLSVSSGGIASAALIAGEYVGATVFVGGSIVSSTIGPGGGLTISSGGAATGTVASGAGITVSSGGAATGSILMSGGGQSVLSGLASGTVIGAGGGESLQGSLAYHETVSSGGNLQVDGASVVSGLRAAAGGVLNNNGQITLLAGDFISGGLLSSAVLVGNNGTIAVQSGGLIDGALYNGALIELLPGAAESGLSLTGGGTLEVGSGVAFGPTITDSGQIILSGGEIWTGVAYSGAAQIEFMPGAQDHSGIFGGGFIEFEGSGAAGVDGTFIGADVVVDSGASLSGALLVSVTLAAVSAGATADATTIDDHCTLDVVGGTASGVTVMSGGIEFIYGGLGFDTTVASSGGIGVSAGVLSGLDLASGGGFLNAGTMLVLAGDSVDAASYALNLGTLAASAGGLIEGTITNAGLVTLLSGGTASALTLTGGTLEVDSGGALAGTITVPSLILLYAGDVSSDVTCHGPGGTLELMPGAQDSGGVFSVTQVTLEGAGALALNDVFSGANLVVSSGAEVSGATFTDGGTETVLVGGTIDGCTVENNAQLTVSGVTISTTVGSGDTESISGGHVFHETVEAGGQIIVGGSASEVSGLRVAAGGLLTNDGGVVNLSDGDSIDNPASWLNFGTLNVSAGASIAGSATNPGTINLLPGAAESGLDLSVPIGVLNVSSGVAFGATIENVGTTNLYAGEVWSGVAYSGGGNIYILASAGDEGGTFHDNAVYVTGAGAFGSGETVIGGNLYVSAGGSVSGDTLTGAAYEWVSSGGTATATTLGSNCVEEVSAGGAASGTVIDDSGYSYANSGGAVVGTVINADGYQEIEAGGASFAALVNSGGSQYVNGGTTTGTTVFSGGVESVHASGIAAGTILSGGSAVLSGARIDVSATSASADSGSLIYSGGGIFQVDGTIAPAATIYNFDTSAETIDLTGIGGVIGTSSYSVDDGFAVTFSGTAGSMTLSIYGAEGEAAFTMVPDGSGGIDVVVGAPQPTLALLPADDSGIPGDGITNDTDPTFEGSGVAGETVTLYSGTTEIGSTTVGLDGTWDITPGSPFVDGIYAIGAVQQGTTGPASAMTPFALRIDTAIPDPPGTLTLAPASDSGVLGDDITSIARPTITGTGIPGDTVTLYDGETEIATAVVAGNGTWGATPAEPLPDGPQTLDATQTGGNTSPFSDGLVVTIDTAPPAPPATLTLAPAGDSGVQGDDITNIALPTITGTSVPDGTIDLYDGTTLIGTGTADGRGAWSVVATAPLGIGANILTATVTDVAGNLSAASSTLDVTFVTSATPPAGLTLAPASDSGVQGDDITNVALPVITGSAEAGATIELYDGATLIGTGTADGTGAWSVTATTPLTEGANSLTATETDIAANLSSASAVLVVTLDTTAPSAPGGLTLAPASDSGMQGDDLTNVALPTITGTGTPGDAISLYDGETQIGTGTVDGAGAWSITATTPLAEGANSLRADETNFVGNASDQSAALVVTLETVAPAAPAGLLLSPGSDSGAQGDDITNVATPTVTGTAVPDATVNLYDGATLIGTGTADGTGAWAIATPTLSSGTHDITATVIDAAGNVSGASAALPLIIDRTPPGAPTLGETTATTNPAEPRIDGGAEAGSTVRLYQDGTLIDTTSFAGRTWSYDYPDALAAGTYTLTATATDVAGNLSPVSAPMTLKVNGDDSYAIVTPVPDSTNTKSYVYDSNGVLSQVDTDNANTQLLLSVSDTATLINIYDSAGNLIGTVAQPSISAFSNPIYDTSPQSSAASTGSGPIGSVVNLLAEDNFFVSQGNDTITTHSGTSTIFATGPSVVVQNLAATVSFYGGSGAASVYGGSGTVIAFGGQAGGTLIGGSGGNNILVAGGGPTTMVGGGNGDDLYGAATGDDTLFAGSGTEILLGGGGTDTLIAGAGDYAYGGSGTSTLFASATGVCVLVGGSGDSTLWGGGGADVFLGGAAITSDTVMVGGNGGCIFLGGAGTTTAYGGSGTDQFWVGSGAMTIIEGSGADIVGFGVGAATVTGGAGADLYEIVNGKAGGADTISNFKVGTDHLALQGYGANALQQQVAGGNTVLTLADHTSVVLVGVTQLAAGSILS